MRRLTAVAASAVLVGLSLTSYDAPASAATPTCHGQPATIVGTQGQPLHGTPRDDVIVTNGATFVYAGEGDDLICATGVTNIDPDLFPDIIAGPGSDTVDTTAVDETYAVALGTTTFGTHPPPRTSSDVDAFVGGAEADLVFDPGGETVDIATGGGDDRVWTQGSDVRADISLGTGSDVFHEPATARPGGPVAVDGGPGADEIDVTSGPDRPAATRWVVDDRRHQATTGGRVAFTWTDVSGFDLAVANGHSRFVGGPSDETLMTDTYASATGPLKATMGKGDDTVVVAPGPIDVDGGPGTDLIHVDYPEPAQFVHVDLAAGAARFDTHRRRQQASGFEDVQVESSDVPILVRGDDGPNAIHVGSSDCRVRVDGRGGDDAITTYGPPSAVRLGCVHADRLPWLLLGGPGDDRLFGSNGGDVLTGGAGDDDADGRGGVDTCVAEHEKSCERS